MSNFHAAHDARVSARADLQLSLLALVESENPADGNISPASDAEPEDREERRYRRLLARKERIGDLTGMAACYIRLGDIFLSRGDSEQAGEMYRKSLKIARALNSASAAKGVPPQELL
jgi:hypothetical protein